MHQSNNNREQSRLSKRLSRLLFFCWALIVLHIWFASDNWEDRQHLRFHGMEGVDDPEYNLRYEGFGVPAREFPSKLKESDELNDRKGDSETRNELGEIAAMTAMTEAKGARDLTNDSSDSISSLASSLPSLSSLEGSASSAVAKVESISHNAASRMNMLSPNAPNAPINALPEALRPITNSTCCFIAANQNKSNPDDLQCFGTCLTERACHDVSYPFSSAEEKAMFPLLDVAELDPRVRSKLGEECFAPERMTPPVEWCQSPQKPQTPAKRGRSTNSHGRDMQQGTTNYLVRGIPPAGCSLRFQGGGSGAFQNLLIFPSAKLAFCGIPKVGITQWVQFLRFVAGAKDYLSLPHYKQDVEFFRFDKLDPSVQTQIWEDESWTFAAFLRDPAERLLSAYLDKIHGQKDVMEYMRSHVGNFTFEKFVEHLSSPFEKKSCLRGRFESFGNTTGLNWCSDPHWRPQVFSCGISERLDRFRFVGDIQHSADQTRELLQHVGLWESHGKHFVNKGVSVKGRYCVIRPETIYDKEGEKHIHTGFQQPDEVKNVTAENTSYGHSKGSKSKMDKYYTAELLDIVRHELYADDYRLWKLVNEKNKMSNGRQLAAELSPWCGTPMRSEPDGVVSESNNELTQSNEFRGSLSMEKQISGTDERKSELPRSGYFADTPNNASVVVDDKTLISLDYVPEALQPITSDKCCFIASLKDSSDNRPDPKCMGTCFTERACNDLAYPFSSAEEKARYPLLTKYNHSYGYGLHVCLSPDPMVPLMEWCQKPHDVAIEEEKPNYLVRNIPPTGCSLKVHGGGSGAFQNLLIFPSAKLAFCGIPKVGITQWIQFARFVAGAKDYISLPHYKQDINFFRFDKLDPSVQKKIWDDENWTFATFLRDPAERLLSAYLDRVQGNRDVMQQMRASEGEFTFDKFVEHLATPSNKTSCGYLEKSFAKTTGLDWCSDPHWRPQVFSCGMSERLDRFQFVGDLQNTAHQTRKLLQHVGLWETHGKHFINEGKNFINKGIQKQSCKIKPISVDVGTGEKPLHVGFQQSDQTRNVSAANTVYGHAKDSKSKMDRYYTPELLNFVRHDLYADDYKLWKLVTTKKEMWNGKALAAQLSTKCAQHG